MIWWSISSWGWNIRPYSAASIFSTEEAISLHFLIIAPECDPQCFVLEECIWKKLGLFWWQGGNLVLTIRAKASLKRRVRAKAAEWVWNGSGMGLNEVLLTWLESGESQQTYSAALVELIRAPNRSKWVIHWRMIYQVPFTLTGKSKGGSKGSKGTKGSKGKASSLRGRGVEGFCWSNAGGAFRWALYQCHGFKILVMSSITRGCKVWNCSHLNRICKSIKYIIIHIKYISF